MIPWQIVYLPLLMTSAGAFSASSSGVPERYVGFDLGTSGSRMSIIEKDGAAPEGMAPYKEIYSDAISWSADEPYDDAKAWVGAVHTLLDRAASSTDYLSTVKSICASGTSASCLIVDANNAGEVTRSPRMYDFDVTSRLENKAAALRAMELLDKHAPPRHTARAATGSLAKLLAWNEESPLKAGEVLCHQADYVALNLMQGGKKCGAGGENRRIISSDWHNVLKCGYDVRNLCWPDWLVECLEESGVNDPVGRGVVPSKVASPGEPVGTVSKTISEKYGIPEDAAVVGGTTDSNAAFFAAATAKAEVGTAVTSLGSTLAIKYLSRTYVEDADKGVYSHRFPVFGGSGGDSNEAAEAWLAGGASNVGCAVLRQQEFSNEELVELSKDIDHMSDSPLQYYPLTKKGERFPKADSEMMPMLEPRPESRTEYLHGILQGISDVERDGFQALGELGASPKMPKLVLSCGGGANNDMWTRMRERRIGNDVVVGKADNTEASFGAALLAAATFS